MDNNNIEISGEMPYTIINIEGGGIKVALIRCPECGKTISDQAAVCIHCGFPIESKNDRSFDSKNLAPSVPEESPKDEQDRQAQAIHHLEQVISGKQVSIVGFSLGVICMIGIIIVLLKMGKNVNDISFGVVWSIFPGFFLIMFLSLLKSSIAELTEAKRNLLSAKENFLSYEKIEKEKSEKVRKEFAEIVKVQAAQHPVCPNCGSTNTIRISTANRMVSVGMVGLASSKIGKQYECKNCKHKW